MKSYLIALLTFLCIAYISDAKEIVKEDYRTIYRYQDGRHCVKLNESSNVKEPRVIEIPEEELPEALIRESKKLRTIYALPDGRHISKLENAIIRIVKKNGIGTINSALILQPLGISPNPINSAATLSFELKASSHVEIYALDCLMNKTTIFRGELQAGPHSIDYDFSSFSKGVITVCVFANGEVLKNKAIIQ